MNTVSKEKEISQKSGYFKTLKTSKTTQTRTTYGCTVKYLDKYTYTERGDALRLVPVRNKELYKPKDLKEFL